MIYDILFFTHTGAIKFERKMKQEGITCELMPVPRALSSNCSVSARIEFEGESVDLIDSQIEKMFILKDNHYELVYESPEI